MLLAHPSPPTRGGMAQDQPQDVALTAADAPAASPLGALFSTDDEIEWTAWGQTPIVSTFGQPQAEYAAIRKATGLMDLPQRGVLEFTGADRHPFLNNLLTNALIHPQTKQAISAGHGCYAFFLNLKGRIVADVRVLEIGGDRTLVECDRQSAAMLLKAFDLYLFGEKVKMRDRSGELHELALHGAQALALLEDAADTPPVFDPPPAGFAPTVDLPVATLTIGGVAVTVWREDLCGVPGLHLLVEREQVVRLWNDLLGRFGQTGDEREAGRRRLR